MKKIQGIIFAFILALSVSVPVFADVMSTDQIPAYSTNYYVIIESPDGGIDMYPSPNAKESRLNDAPIPNGSVLHVDGEKTDDNGKLYGYVEYHGMKGYISLDHTRVISAEEALQTEADTGSQTNVDYDAEAYGRAGSVAMYHGPSDQFDLVEGSTAIPNGEALHVTAEVDNSEGESWVQATHDGVEGWIPEEQILTASKKAILSATPTPTPEPAATSTPAPKLTVTNTPTPKPTNTSTPSPKPTATDTPTPQPTNTSTPSPEPTATDTPTPKPTNTSAPSPEPTATDTPTPQPTNTNTPSPTETSAPTPTETGSVTDAPAETPTEAPDHSGDDFQPGSSDAEKSLTAETSAAASTAAVSPVLIVIGIALVLILILLLIALKRKDNNK